MWADLMALVPRVAPEQLPPLFDTAFKNRQQPSSVSKPSDQTELSDAEFSKLIAAAASFVQLLLKSNPTSKEEFGALFPENYDVPVARVLMRATAPQLADWQAAVAASKSSVAPPQLISSRSSLYSPPHPCFLMTKCRL